MKVVVCGSMTNYPKMLELKKVLTSFGHTVVLPDPGTKEHLTEIFNNNYEDTYDLKIKYDYIKKHYNHIVNSDCVLIANYDKHKIKNYIGGNAFLEMGFAHILNKPVFLLYPVPDISFYYHEMLAIKPIVINNEKNFFGFEIFNI